MSELADGLRHQIDIAEDAGMSPGVFQFFKTIPIVVNDFACTPGLKGRATFEAWTKSEAFRLRIVGQETTSHCISGILTGARTDEVIGAKHNVPATWREIADADGLPT